MSANDFTLTLGHVDGTPVLSVAGEVDMFSAPRLREALVDLTAKGHATLAVDLSDVTFIDSTGLGVLIGVLKRCRTAGGDLVLRGLTARATKVLTLTGLDRVFTIVDGELAPTA